MTETIQLSRADCEALEASGMEVHLDSLLDDLAKEASLTGATFVVVDWRGEPLDLVEPPEEV